MSTTYEQLLRDHQGYLKYVAFSITRDKDKAGELYQATLAKLVEQEEKFRDNTNFKAWAAVIMRNLYINEYRKIKKRKESAATADRMVLSASSDTVNNEGEQNLTLDFVYQKVESLREPVKTVFKLYLDGFHYQEIAKQLHLPLGTVKSQIHSARKILKKQVRELRA